MKFTQLLFLFIIITFFSSTYANSSNKFDDLLITNYKQLPLEFKIGQLLMIGFSGYTLNTEITEYITKYNIGGVTLFDKTIVEGRLPNIKNPKQVKQLNYDIQNIAKIKLFIAVDEEGGKVARLRQYNGFYTPKSAKELGDINDIQITYNEAKKTALMLQDAGFNFNYAPVVDVNVNTQSPAIGLVDRSFSSDFKQVIKHAKSYIQANRDIGIITSIKHFPGHGSAVSDSHKGFVDITNTYMPYEAYPFVELIKVNYADTVLVAHVINKNIDSKYPASISKKFITNILRNKMGFQGVVVTDDLKMKAIESHWTLEETLVNTLNSGSDIIVYLNNIGKYNHTFVKDAIHIISKNVNNGNISEDTINQAYLRVMKLKKEKLYK